MSYHRAFVAALQRSSRSIVCWAGVVGLVGLAASSTAWAQESGRLAPLPIAVRQLPKLLVVTNEIDAGKGGEEGGVAGAGTCPQQISAYTNSNFGPGSYILQGGFAEGESAAVSFTISPDDFPLRIDLSEMIFGTSGAMVQTTTEWNWTVWEGYPNDGIIVAQYGSLQGDLPQIIMPPGTNGVNVQVTVDPGDPEQIVVTDNGSHTFSVGYTITKHNQQTQNPCIVEPPSCCNAFPATDVGGLASSTGNWLYALNCGPPPIFCPSGWKKFSQLGLCQPSGDWVIRVTWTSYNCTSAPTGACCLSDFCIDATEAECIAEGGTYQGDGTVCQAGTCLPPPTTAPCCFPATSGCLDLEPALCASAGGVPGQVGDLCVNTTCFPKGACCLPDGTCADELSPEECSALSGTYQGNGSVCANVDCPEPLGACCFPTGFCLTLTEASCVLTGATWAGAGTTCDDQNANGMPDGCEPPAVTGDLNGDGHVDGADLGDLLSQWGTAGTADLNGDGVVNGADLGVMLANWG
ncbi:MAG: hypothetical protein KDA22_14685 [Phycisphaerales bacterium]|nr:hypothetical protein [Phycisphaerales bacterium]